jgi:hypothetical protein
MLADGRMGLRSMVGEDIGPPLPRGGDAVIMARDESGMVSKEACSLDEVFSKVP